MVNQPVIELNISELILHGYTTAEAYRIKDAMERELTRLFSMQGVSKHFTRDVEIPLMNLGNIQTKGLSPESTGYELANTVYRGLSEPSPNAASTQPGSKPTF